MASILFHTLVLVYGFFMDSSWLTGRAGWGRLSSTGGPMNIVKQNVDMLRTDPFASGFQPAGSISGDSPGDTAALREMAATAQKYLLSFHWCPAIKQLSLAYGIGGVVAVFLVQFAEKINGKDEFVWVINGDIPSAYLVIDNAPSPSDALRIYCNLMQEWVDTVIGGKDLANVFAIDAKPTRRNAHSLSRRIQFLRETIIPIAKSQYH